MALAQGVRDMASAVSNIQHAPTADGKAAMATIQGNDQAPDRAKALAGIIAGFSYMASADAKAQLAELFP